jgi:hypothetical protein
MRREVPVELKVLYESEVFLACGIAAVPKHVCWRGQIAMKRRWYRNEIREQRS